MLYSGRTTAPAHKFDDWEEKGKGIGDDCIQQQTVFDVQWSNCPVEVEEDVKKLWESSELGNDYYYYRWSNSDHEAKTYPLISEYLKSRDITECLINWWW